MWKLLHYISRLSRKIRGGGVSSRFISLHIKASSETKCLNRKIFMKSRRFLFFFRFIFIMLRLLCEPLSDTAHSTRLEGITTQIAAPGLYAIPPSPFYPRRVQRKGTPTLNRKPSSFLQHDPHFQLCVSNNHCKYPPTTRTTDCAPPRHQNPNNKIEPTHGGVMPPCKGANLSASHARGGAAGLADGHVAVHGRPDLRAVVEAHPVRVPVVPLLDHLAQLPRGLGDLWFGNRRVHT